jgi:hypothetical protein
MVTIVIGLWLLIFAPLMCLPLLVQPGDLDRPKGEAGAGEAGAPPAAPLVFARGEEDLRVAAAWLATSEHTHAA